MFDYKNEDLLFNERAKEIVRKPLGIPIFKEAHLAIKHLKTLIEDFEPSLIATVGDVVTLNLIYHNIIPDISLVDFKTKRKKIEKAKMNKVLVMYDIKLSLKNPRSTITKESWSLIEEAIAKVAREKIKCLIIVKGEEDLLTLPLSIAMPDRSFVVYGQPEQALILIIINEYVRNAFSTFLHRLVKQL